MNRRRVPELTETLVLTQSGRRCCICFGLNGDSAVKRGQVAHLDRDPGNNNPDNLAFLCLDHHDEYDTRPSQSKRLTKREVKEYRDRLCRGIQGASGAVTQATATSPWAQLWPLGKWTSDHDEALELHVIPHRSQSVVLAVSAGPKTVEEINSHVPPCDLDWTRTIIEGVEERGWIQRTQGAGDRFELTERGVRILRALEQIPEETKAAAWKEIWRDE